MKKNVPIFEFAVIEKPKRRYITKEMVKTIAEKVYSENGRGITFHDLQIEFHISKDEAQRTLKHMRGFLFTAEDLEENIQKLMGLKRTSPQHYFLAEKKAEIIELRKKNVLKDTTGVMPSSIDLLKAQSFQDVLVRLYSNLLYIHNMQLEAFVQKDYYDDLSIKPEAGNKCKIIEEKIGFVKGIFNVKLMIYPNGTIMIHVKNSEKPFRIVYESDVLHIMTFLGRIEERLHAVFTDTKDRILPPVRYWILKECDVNKDVSLTGLGQIILPDLQIPLADRALRGYVKILSGDPFYRIELSMRPNEYVVEALERIKSQIKIDENTVKS